MKTETSRQIKTFTEVPSMWHGFAGCKCWANGDEPVFTDIGNWLLVADVNGTGVYGDEEKDAYGGMFIDSRHLTQKSAIAFLRGLPDDFNPSDFGAVDCQ